MTTRPPEKVLTSFHEAGHAICAALVSKSLGATIDALGLSGRARCVQPSNAVQNIATDVAGGIAEWLRDGRRRNRFSYMSSVDLSNADLVLRRHYKREVNAEKTPEFWQAVIIAEDILHQHWGAVEHVARRLMMKEKISGELVKAVLDEHKRKEKQCQSANWMHRKTA
jgi:hypothetical protein